MYSIALTGNTGNTVPLLSLGSAVTQTVDISDTTNAILNLQLGVGSAGINVTNAAATLQIDSQITNNTGVTTANLVKTGAGALVLTNTSNSYSGQVQISGGTLSIDSNGELGNAANAVELDGGALRMTPASTLSIARPIIVDSNGGTITTSSTAANSTTFSSPLGGSGSLTKNGAAELILNNSAGTFSGTITVSQGNVRIINPGSTAAGTDIKLTGSGATLNLRADANTTYNTNVEAITGGITVQIFGSNQTAGNSGHTLSVGNIKLGSTLNIGGSSSYVVGASQVNLSGNGTIASNTANMIVNGGIIESGGSHSLTKNGTGVLTIKGTSSYAGNTTVLNGTLILSGSNALTPVLAGPGVGDIQHGEMAFNYTDSSTPAAAVRSAIASHQLRDSVAFANETLGYFDDTISQNVNVLPAYFGDATLDGTVGSDDFAALAAHFGQTGSAVGWANGDFNYDGTVNALDFNALASNYGLTLSAAAPADSLGAVVPEPTLGITSLGFILLSKRRWGSTRMKKSGNSNA
jgi:autotransporter-associated beta strand protein